MPEITPFAMSRFVALYHCECEYELDETYPNTVYLWEPLHAQKPLTKTDSPSWGNDSICFYRKVHKDWVYVNRHLMFSRGASPDVLILPNGLCVEVTSAQVVWRATFEQWFIRWHGYTNSRFAKLAKHGLDAWRGDA